MADPRIAPPSTTSTAAPSPTLARQATEPAPIRIGHRSFADFLAAARTNARFADDAPGTQTSIKTHTKNTRARDRAAHDEALRPGRADDRGSRRPRDPRDPEARSLDPVALGPVLPSMLGPVHHAPAVVGSAEAQAELVTLAERLVTSMRIGGIGPSVRRLDLRLRAQGGSEVDVRLELENGSLRAVLGRGSASRATAERLAARIEAELCASKLAAGSIEVVLE